MMNWLWLIPALPLAGAVILMLVGPRLSKSLVSVVGVGSVSLAGLVTFGIIGSFLNSPPVGYHYSQALWTWMDVAGFRPTIGLYLDPISLVMLFVVTFVGSLIHFYSTEYMEEEEGYNRFFAYMNLFVASMLLLVLADDLLLLFLGWEGVGLCSYLLIGFWYKDPANGRAAQKAFLVTRVGDTAMTIGLFLIFLNLGTLNIQQLMDSAQRQWPVGSGLAVAASALLLGGALGKSAQLPLQTWLPDAMAGPAPVSALIHAATMVTAGVYLVARTHVLFALAPSVQHWVAIIGALTLLLAGFSALVQTDIKKVLAYSTISQIGYMFLALGVGAWSAAIFHLMIHAFFKGLLFLAAGAIIIALHHEQNMFKMGGLRKDLPLVFWTFLIGSGALAAFPLVTAGFYSKDLILWDAWSSSQGSQWLWLGGIAGALMTSIYIFRAVFITFFGEAKTHVHKPPRAAMSIPLLVLAALSIIGGYIQGPFLGLLHNVLPAVAEREGAGSEMTFKLISVVVGLTGILIAWVFFLRSPSLAESLAANSMGRLLSRWWFSDWGMDGLYNLVFVLPYRGLAWLIKSDVVDWFYRFVAWLNRLLWTMLSRTETGRIRWYAAGIAAGAVILVAIAVFA